jgi:hypothetical protein
MSAAYRDPAECQECRCVCHKPAPRAFLGWHRLVAIGALAVVLGWASGLSLGSLGHLAVGVLAVDVALIIIFDWLIRGGW